MIRIKSASAFLALALLFSGCSNSKQPDNSSTPANNVISPVNSQRTALPANAIDHVLVVIEENHSYSQITGNPDAPYLNYLAKHGAYFTHSFAIEHPSQPNYLDIFSGSNQGVTSDAVPPRRFTVQNLGSELLQKGLGFGGYSEDLPSIGFSGVQYIEGGYARKHNPWVNFTNIPPYLNMPFTSFPRDLSKLPTVSFVIPNLLHDMHDGTVAEGDAWLKDNLDSYVNWAQRNNSLLIVTWDEDDQTEGNRIPTIFIGPMVKPGVYHETINHFSVLRTIEDLYSLAHAGKSTGAQPIRSIWK
jgi:phosphatidylinositol-3-phosphatase